MRACIILHNMIFEDERASFTQYNKFEFQPREVPDTFTVNMPSNIGENVGTTMDRRTRLRNRQIHENLKDDLIENIWAKFEHLPNIM